MMDQNKASMQYLEECMRAPIAILTMPYEHKSASRFSVYLDQHSVSASLVFTEFLAQTHQAGERL